MLKTNAVKIKTEFYLFYFNLDIEISVNNQQHKSGIFDNDYFLYHKSNISQKHKTIFPKLKHKNDKYIHGNIANVDSLRKTGLSHSLHVHSMVTKHINTSCWQR